MTRLSHSGRVAPWVLLLLLLCLCLPQAAGAAGQTVLVLPFAIRSNAELPNAQVTVPQAIIDKLRDKGMAPVVFEKARDLLVSSGLKSIDLASARDLGVRAGAELVVYGAFTQDELCFTLDTMIVALVPGAAAVPVRIVRPGMDDLPEAAEQLASRASAVLANPVAASAAAQAPAAPAASAEQRPAAPAYVPMNLSGGKPIDEVQIRGLKNLELDAVLMRLTIRKGDAPDAEAINQEVIRIWEMGYFTDVQAHLEGSVLVFDVVEKPRIENIIVEGAKEIDAEDVLAAMTSRKGSVLNEQTLAEDLQAITELYRKDGYYLAKPTYRVEQRQGAPGASLVISIDEGKKLYVTQIKIDGLKDLKQGDIEKYLALKERSIISFITGTGVLKEDLLDRDTNAIAAYGLNEGYIDIQVGTPQVEYLEDGIHVTYPVSEGERFYVNDVLFVGDVLDKQENMEKLVEMDDWKKEKGYFSITVMQDDAKKLQRYYNDMGYAFADVDTRVAKVADEPNKVNVVYVINKKQKVYIRRLLVEGNTHTRDNVILREMRLGDGDQFTGEKMRRSMERLNRTRYFSALDSELIPTANEDQVDLKVKVKDGNTGSLMAGVGYSTYYDVGVNAAIMERNLLGSGYQLGLNAFFSWRRTSGTLTFNNPRVYDTDLSLGNDLYYTRDYWDSFTRDTIGDTIRIGYPIGEYTTVGLSYRLERYEIYDVSRSASPYITDYKGINWTSAVGGRITRDTTDDRDRPTKGTITRIWGEWGGGGIGGTDNFVKLVAEWQGFYSFNPTNTIHVRGRLGGIFQNSDKKIPVFERFYVGGMETVRGYSYTDASPRAQDPKYDKDVIGGDRMGVFNFEYVWTFDKELGLALVPFFDLGFNYSSDDGQCLQLDFDKNWVYSTGLEVRWKSPMGDLRIAYGIPLKKDFDGEQEPGRLEFSMGQFF